MNARKHTQSAAGRGPMKPYYTDEKHGITIYNCDCRDVLGDLPRVDLVLTDPPYGVGLGVKANNQRFDRLQYTQVDDTEAFVRTVVDEVLPLCRARADRIVLTPGVKNLFCYPRPTHTGSFYYPAASGCNPWGFSCWQPILFYGKDPYGGTGSKADSLMSTEAAEHNGHPCPKPIRQWSWLLQRTSKERELILDPFMGSGTTLVAAKRLGRRCIGVEIERKYCDIAIQRLEAATLELFENLPEQEVLPLSPGERCDREIQHIKTELRAGNPDVQGLCRALVDWSTEKRLLEEQP